ncbi:MULTISPECIES: hypothetical protein [unclassified Halomonas]|uniref:hypothetical protein n=1 Tax=unclassified Halomonas TaxID=2609666 RepID=UPI001EF74B69|nr:MULTISPECIES: hypothetical protein [unclassified Halomonas]MCG7590833.1 hypothetical protein [Halomonas sp. McD50-5]MCG7616945.1 hypothetical protein [Halomonas sp. McD50-4]
MLKPPITLPIVRSKLAVGVQVALVLGLALLTARALSVWVSSGMLVISVWLIVRAYRTQRCGELHLVQNGSQWEGYWLQSTGEPGVRLGVSCDYLGPWLVGLRIGALRMWVWPDSLPNASQRALRRCFHRPGR